MKTRFLLFVLFCSKGWCGTSPPFTFSSNGDSPTAISKPFDFSNGNSFFSESFSFTKEIEKKKITETLEEEKGIFEVEKFGYFLRFEGTQWCYHIDWGWMYMRLQDATNQSIWYHIPNRGWHWTSLGADGRYPHIYANKLGSWLYRKKENGQNMIYSYQSKTWQKLTDYIGTD